MFVPGAKVDGTDSCQVNGVEVLSRMVGGGPVVLGHMSRLDGTPRDPRAYPVALLAGGHQAQCHRLQAHPLGIVDLDEQSDGSRSRLFRGGTGDEVTQQSPPRLRRMPHASRRRTEESCTHHPQRQSNGVLAVGTDRTVAFSDIDHVSAGAVTEPDLE